MSDQLQLLREDEGPPDSAVQKLVASYVESYIARTGHRPPERVLGQVSRQLKKLIAEGRVTEILELALDSMVRKALSPQLLPQLVAEAEIRAETARAREYVAVHGWPTGWRFVRHPHGTAGAYRRDPLGHDWPPGERPRTPTLEEIEEALP